MNRLIRVGIVGSRSRDTPKDKDLIRQVLVHRINKGDTLHLVSGGCPKGADRFAEELAKELNLGISIHYPDKSKLPPNHTVYDYARICYARNTLIANECDILTTTWDGKSNGTRDTIKKTEAQEKPVLYL